MAKSRLYPPYDQLESDIIDTLLAGHQEYRPDLGYPQSHSDMQAAVRGLLRMYEIKRRPMAVVLEFPCYHCKGLGEFIHFDTQGVQNTERCKECSGKGKIKEKSLGITGT